MHIFAGKILELNGLNYTYICEKTPELAQTSICLQKIALQNTLGKKNSTAEKLNQYLTHFTLFFTL